MPRRPPPSSLNLIQGPLPGRGEPKHTLPSRPRPTFCPGSSDASLSSSKSVATIRSKKSSSALTDASAGSGVLSAGSTTRREGMAGTTGSKVLVVATAGLTSNAGGRSENTPSTRIVAPLGASKTRGPWDYSVLIPPLDVDSILPPPQPVAISE